MGAQIDQVPKHKKGRVPTILKRNFCQQERPCGQRARSLAVCQSGTTVNISKIEYTGLFPRSYATTWINMLFKRSAP